MYVTALKWQWISCKWWTIKHWSSIFTLTDPPLFSLSPHQPTKQSSPCCPPQPTDYYNTTYKHIFVYFRSVVLSFWVINSFWNLANLSFPFIVNELKPSLLGNPRFFLAWGPAKSSGKQLLFHRLRFLETKNEFLGARPHFIGVRYQKHLFSSSKCGQGEA